MKMRHVVLTLTALLATDAAVLAQAGAQDVIVTRDGSRVRGVSITAMTMSTISYDRAGTAGELPASRLLDVQWGEPPDGLLIGRGALKHGDFESAASAFADAASAATRDVLKAECAFLEAEALQRGAGSDQQKAGFAADKLSAWLAAHPQGYRTPDALLALGRAQVAAGDGELAAQTFRKLADTTLTEGLAPIWGARGKLGEARAQLATGDLIGAGATFRAAISSAQTAAPADGPANPELIALEAEASVGIGAAMMRDGKLQDALTYFEDLARNAERDTVRAAAKAGEGEARYLSAKDSGDVDALRGAQVALAEAILLDTSSGDATAKAMYYSGMVLLALGPDHESSTFRQRAMQYFDTVTKRHSDTEWAARAAEAARG